VSGAPSAAAAAALAENPFFVLGVSPDASRIELEREAQKLLGMLELGFAEARAYPTPLGPRERTAEMVRAAVAQLRDPYRRLVAELWARHAPAAAPAPEPPPAAPAGWPGLRRTLGWP
jgi:methylase of polypeptide subunit release factors